VRVRVVAALAVCAALGAAGCAESAATERGSVGRLAVVATTTQVADFARNVGGDDVSVTQLLQPNVDPHDYEAAPADVLAVARATLVLKNGVGLEAFLDGAIEAAGFTGTVVDTSEDVRIRQGAGDDERGGDPHVWHDPRNARLMARTIADAFGAADPAHKPAYEANYRAYAARLDALDRDIAAKIATIPADRRKLVTNHDAFGYYAARYGLAVVGSIIPSFDTSAELSGTGISSLVAEIRATRTPAIFAESSLPPRTAQTIATEAGVRVVAGEGALYGDTLGPAGSPAATYVAMEEHNTDTIVGALRG
jgi:ABC-type Zn uptake system ZnuABC Zn-binding protein ZnuA